MQIVPLKPVPNQAVLVRLSNSEVTQVTVYQKDQGLFMDLYVENVPIVIGVICLNLNLIVRSAYLPFTGDFTWLDNQGTADPVYTGIGDRFNLIYIAPGELD